jgi:hypothetical protein
VVGFSAAAGALAPLDNVGASADAAGAAPEGAGLVDILKSAVLLNNYHPQWMRALVACFVLLD